MNNLKNSKNSTKGKGIVVVLIVWKGSQNWEGIWRCPPHCELAKEGFNHPVVVVGIHRPQVGMPESNTRISVVQVSHLYQTSTGERRPYLVTDSHNQLTSRKSLPVSEEQQTRLSVIGSGDANPPPLYRCQDGQRLRKRCYIRMPHVYNLPISVFRTFDGKITARAYSTRLDEQSFRCLVKDLGLPEFERQVFVSDRELSGEKEEMLRERFNPYRMKFTTALMSRPEDVIRR